MTNKHIGYEFPKWVTGLMIYRVAKRIIRNDKEYIVSIFARGRDSIMTVLEFYLLRDEFVNHELLILEDKYSLSMVFKWTERGEIFLNQILDFYDPPPPPLR